MGFKKLIQSGALLLHPLAALLRSLSHANVWVVNVAYDAMRVDLPKHPRGFGFLVPSSEVKDNVSYILGDEAQKQKAIKSSPLYGLLGVVFDSDTFPQNHVRTITTYNSEPRIGHNEVMTLMIGGDRFPELANATEEEIKSLALQHLRVTLGYGDGKGYWDIPAKDIRYVPPDILKATLTRNSIPQFRPGHSLLAPALKQDIEASFGQVFGQNLNPDALPTVYDEVNIDGTSKNRRKILTRNRNLFYLSKYGRSGDDDDLFEHPDMYSHPRVTVFNNALGNPALGNSIETARLHAEKFVTFLSNRPLEAKQLTQKQQIELQEQHRLMMIRASNTSWSRKLWVKIQQFVGATPKQ